MGLVLRALLALLTLSLASTAFAADDTFNVLPGTCVGDCGDVVSTGYFVDSSAPDGGDGLSDATAWNEVSDISVPAGADVWFKRGSTFNEQLNITWSGTVSNTSIVGCYYYDAGNRNLPTSCEAGTDPISVGDSDMPTFSGTLTPACMAAQNCAYGTGAALPTSDTQGMLNIVEQDYVIVQDLAFTNSAGRAFNIRGADNGIPGTASEMSEYITIRRNYFYYSAFNMVMEKNIKRHLVEDNYFDTWNVCEIELAIWMDARCANGGPWPGGVMVSASPESYVLIQGNTLVNAAGEAVNCLVSTHVVARQNITGRHFSNSFYGDVCDHFLAEENFSFGNPNNDSIQPGRSKDFGTNISSAEDGPHLRSYADTDMRNLLFRNNVVLGRGTCLKIGPEATIQDEVVNGALFYGNTCFSIDFDAVKIDNKGGVDSDIRNSIFTFRSTEICDIDVTTASTTFGYNYWEEQPVAFCRGIGDIYGGALNFPITEQQAEDFTDTDITGMTREQLINAYGTPGTGAVIEYASEDMTTALEPMLAAANWDWIPSYLGSEWREEKLSTDALGNNRCPVGSLGAVETTNCSISGLFVDSVAGVDTVDCSTGGTVAAPWKTLAKAESCVSDGDALYLKSDSVFVDEELYAPGPNLTVDTYCVSGANAYLWTSGGAGCGSKVYTQIIYDNAYGPYDYVAAGTACPNIPTTFNNTPTPVSTEAAFNTAYAAADPGDAVVIADGTYDWDTVKTLNRAGTASEPIYILPETQGGVTFNNSAGRFDMRAAYQVIAGFNFTSFDDIPIIVGAPNNRVACNTFTWVDLATKVALEVYTINPVQSQLFTPSSLPVDFEIDNNTFDGSSLDHTTAPGAWAFRVVGSDSSSPETTGGRIHHNEWKDRLPSSTLLNSLEAIILGVGSDSNPENTNNDMGALIENNLFDNFDGEAELISMKSSQNLIRNNCALTNQGYDGEHVVTRSGHYNFIYGNWFEGFRDGPRHAGTGHQMVFNYFGANSSSVDSGIRINHGSASNYYVTDFLRAQYNVYNRYRYLLQSIGSFAGDGAVTGPATDSIVTDNNIYSTVWETDYNEDGENAGNSTRAEYVAAGNLLQDNTVTASNLSFNGVCGDAALFDGPGDESTTTYSPLSRSLETGDISPPSWWD